MPIQLLEVREITPEEYKNATGQILVGGVRTPMPKT
jgi:hypothetical protein